MMSSYVRTIFIALIAASALLSNQYAAAEDIRCLESPRCASIAAEAERQFSLGAYQQALDLYRRAYARRPDPRLLLNIGRTLQVVGEVQSAMETYQRCQQAGLRDADLQQRLSRYLDEAQQQLAAAPAAVPPPSKERVALYRRWQLWVGVGAIAAAGAAIGLAAHFLSQPHLVNKEPPSWIQNAQTIPGSLQLSF